MRNRTISTVAAAVCLAGAAAADPLDEMLATDRAFAALAATEGAPTAFAAYAAEDVRMFPEGDVTYQGREKLIERFARWPAGATLSWTPQGGAASPSGDFGYTWGLSIYTAVDATGATTSKHGKYVSVWRREADGSWKFVADIGNGAPAPDEAPATPD